MKSQILTVDRVRRILRAAARTRVLVIGDVMLDQFIWGRVSRISPEAPVPVVEFERESFMPGGAANVARNLTALKTSVDVLGVIGRDDLSAGRGVALEPVIRRRVVRCGDHDPGVALEVPDGEREQGGRAGLGEEVDLEPGRRQDPRTQRGELG